MNTKKKEIQKKGKDKKKSVPVSPALYHGIFMLTSNVDTSIELESPCCSYMCFFEFLCGPANCLSVNDIVFPMFWTFLW
jgi:hypothetical protein